MVAQYQQKVFGSGRFWGVPTASNSTPSNFLVAQSMSLDLKRDIKRLYGQNQLPVDIASGMLSVVGKVTMGTVNPRIVNDLMLGDSLTTGKTVYVNNETIVPSSLTAIMALANQAGWSLDLGVFNFATGVPLTKVASTTPATTGTYAVTSSGVYVANATDAAALNSLRVSYLYSTSGGETISMANQAMGRVGGFQAVMGLLWTNPSSVAEQVTIQLNSCIASDYALATVLDDYTKPTFGFEASTDASDILGTMTFAEVY